MKCNIPCATVQCWMDRLEFDLKLIWEPEKPNCILFADLYVTFSVCSSSSLGCRNGCELQSFSESLLRAQLALLYKIDSSALYCMYFSRWVPTASVSVWKTTIIPSSRISEATQKRAELRKLISSGLRAVVWMNRQRQPQLGDF